MASSLGQKRRCPRSGRGHPRSGSCFVPNKSATKKGEPYRYLAIRERLKQPLLPGMDYLPFQTVSFDETQYKLFGMVSNMRWEGDKLIDWHHERCGKSEES